MVLQHKLGAKNAGTFDVGCACASFPPLIAIGSGLIATNPAIKTILGRTQMRREKGTFSRGTPHRSAAIAIEGSVAPQEEPGSFGSVSL